MTDLKTKKSIVIYFSRADENYGVGYIEKWNTEVIAEYIQELVWADLFKVERKTPYAKEFTISGFSSLSISSWASLMQVA